MTCFDLYSQGDANGVNASHAKQLVKIREKEAKVQAKIVELNKLKAPKEPVVVDSTPVAVPIAEVPPPTQTMAVPVPPDASPGQQIAVVLPDGKTVAASRRPAERDAGHRVPHPPASSLFYLHEGAGVAERDAGRIRLRGRTRATMRSYNERKLPTASVDAPTARRRRRMPRDVLDPPGRPQPCARRPSSPLSNEPVKF